MKHLVGFVLFFVLNTPTFAQLVNIETRRMQDDSTRFVFQANVSGSYTNNNGNTFFQTRPSLAVQAKSKDLNTIFFVIGDYRLVRSKDNDIANARFLHMRYNRKLIPGLTLEVFIQSQRDGVLEIKSRNLGGIGGRIKAFSSEHASLYVGYAYMYEREEANFVDEAESHHRNSSYLTLNASIPGTDVSITNTFYYQPLYSDFGDYRMLEQLRLNISITESISLFGLFNYYYDSITLQEERQFSSTTSAGLGISL